MGVTHTPRAAAKPPGKECSMTQREYRLYIVEILNTLTMNREHIHTDGFTAKEAVASIEDKIPDGYEVINVFVESDEIWE